MNKSKKHIASLVMTMILVLNITLNVSAADSSVTYEGGADKFVFLPGSGYTDSDLFDGFKNVMPGDTLTETIEIKNTSKNSDYVKIYMRAETHNEDQNPLTYSETYEIADDKDQTYITGQRDETVATMRDFLSQLKMRVYKGSELIFEAEPDELDGLAQNVLLGSFYPGESTELTVELTVPIELGNEYANRVGEIDWVFLAEEIDRTSSQVILEADKLLDGAIPKANAFEFVVKDKNEKVLQTVTNDENGHITFNALTFDTEGEYHFTISEKKSSNDTIIYDEVIYDVAVKVTSTRENYVTETIITVDGDIYEGTPIFHNKTIVNNDEIKTGDISSPFTYIVILIVSIIVIISIIFMKKHSKTPGSVK